MFVLVYTARMVGGKNRAMIDYSPTRTTATTGQQARGNVLGVFAAISMEKPHESGVIHVGGCNGIRLYCCTGEVVKHVKKQGLPLVPLGTNVRPRILLLNNQTLLDSGRSLLPLWDKNHKVYSRPALTLRYLRLRFTRRRRPSK